MNMERYTEVIEQLDKQAHPLKMNFPAFGASFYYVDSRISVFSDRSFWTIIIESIEVNYTSLGHSRNFNTIYRYGNNLRRTIEKRYNQYDQITQDGNDGPVFVDGELNPKVQTMKVRGHLVPVPHDPKIYEEKGMLLVGREKLIPSEYEQAYGKNISLIDKDGIQPENVLRALTPEYRNYFFLSDEEKQTEQLYPIPKILQLEEWRHPLYNEDNILELPSKCEAFQMIAKVIATCDPLQYAPTEKPNTHWRNWLIADKYI